MCRSWVPGDRRIPPPQLVPTRRPPSRISTGTSVDIETQTGAAGLTGGFASTVGGGLATTGAGADWRTGCGWTVGSAWAVAATPLAGETPALATGRGAFPETALVRRTPSHPASKAPPTNSAATSTACGEARGRHRVRVRGGRGRLRVNRFDWGRRNSRPRRVPGPCNLRGPGRNGRRALPFRLDVCDRSWNERWRWPRDCLGSRRRRRSASSLRACRLDTRRVIANRGANGANGRQPGANGAPFDGPNAVTPPPDRLERLAPRCAPT